MTSAGEVGRLEFEAVEITEDGGGSGGRLKHLLRERLNFVCSDGFHGGNAIFR